LNLYFILNKPFPIFKKYTKSLNISLWGKIYESNSIDVINEAATLDGEYSNVDFHIKNRSSGKNALRWLTA